LWRSYIVAVCKSWVNDAKLNLKDSWLCEKRIVLFEEDRDQDQERTSARFPAPGDFLYKK